LPSGFIIRGVGGFYYVDAVDGTYECKARGTFRKDGITPLPGDNVVFTITDPFTKTGFITSISDRKSVLVRPAVANVDQIVIVFAIKSPEPDFLLLDKLIIAAVAKKLDIVICVNKIDLDTGDGFSSFERQYAACDLNLIGMSAREGIGFERLAELLKDKKSVFAGPSGVGKSTILNIATKKAIMKVGSISVKTERGRHTTRHAELINLGAEGIVVDTPGFSSFEIEEIKSDDLQYYYPEFKELAHTCRFKGCKHLREPSCSVVKAVEEGVICKDRYDRYAYLFAELKAKKFYV